MADIKEAIRRLIYQYSVVGADKVVATQEAVAASTTKTDQASLSLEKSFGNLERRYISTVRAQQDYQKVQERVNAAVQQNPALQERANAVLAAASHRYDQATAAQKAFAVATSGVSAQLVAMSAGAGPVGVFLSALGPWGLAAAVGLGAVSTLFDSISEGAKRIGDKSIEMKKFSDVTGLSVTEIKGLTRAGAELGVNSDDITTSVERFSVGLNEARKGSGALFDQVNKINPALARQLAEAKGTAQAFDILAQAIKGATDAAQRNALSRAAFGRGGLETGLVAAETVDKGGVAAMGEQIAKNTGLTKEWVNETARLRNENKALEKQITATTEALFALPMLEFQNAALKVRKDLMEQIIKFGKDFSFAMSQPVFAPKDTFDDRFPVSQRGPSEGAMQAQQEAQAQREVTKAIEDANKARDYAVSVEKMMVTIAQDTAAAEIRKAAVFAQNAEAYKNVSATTAQTLAQLKDQLNVASAVGGAAKMEAEQKATINQLLAQGKSLVDASAIAEAQRAVKQAQINSSAQETLANLQDQNAVAGAIGVHAKIAAQEQATYNNLIRQGVDAQLAANIAAQETANKYAAIKAAHEERLINMREELNVARQTTGLGTIMAQHQATIVSLQLQGLTYAQATAEADMKRAIALAQVESNAEKTLKNLQNENELINARTDAEKANVKARQTYEQLVEDGVSSAKAGDIATQEYANSMDQAAAAARKGASAAGDMADGMRHVAISAQDAAMAIAAYVPMLSAAGSMAYTIGKNLFESSQGGYSQFKPGGYTSSTEGLLIEMLAAQYGRGGFDMTSGAPNAQGREFQFNKLMGGGNTLQAITTSTAGGLMANPIVPQWGTPTVDTAKISLLQRAIETLPKEQQAGPLQQLLGAAQNLPKSLQTTEIIQQLNDKLTQLTTATEANTSATATMTDVLSPFYSSDPRRTHLGFRAFAGGGIMSQYGELPIRHYQGGGMATSPQVAVFGEGSTPEAYVPVPSGRIPVELKQPANSNRRPITVNINVMGNADSGTVAALKSTAFQQAQAMRRVMA